MNTELIAISPTYNDKEILGFMLEQKKLQAEMDPLKLRKATAVDARTEYLRLERKLKEQQGMVFTLLYAEKPIGFAACYLADLSQKTQVAGHISHIFVKTEYRGFGLTSQLALSCEVYLRQLGCRYVTINVFSPNTVAHENYQKLGYLDRDVHLIKPLN